MGILEKEVNKKFQKDKIQKVILGTIYGVGLISTALIAPKMIKIISKFEPEFLKKKNSKYSFNRSLFNLRINGFIVYEKTDRGNFARLTPKGEAKLRQIQLQDYKLKKPVHWDGKWRMLIFDIREERKNTRDKIRRTLIQIGFVRLQDSVWVYPYDCENLINLLKIDYKIGLDVLYVIADKIEYEKSLLKIFNLDKKL
ncbi:MAG: hypothetical protein WC839_03750 [Candidatus Paceibacterota bacterium]